MIPARSAFRCLFSLGTIAPFLIASLMAASLRSAPADEQTGDAAASSPKSAPAAATTPPAVPPAEPTEESPRADSPTAAAKDPQPAVAVQDFSAFIAALGAAERANEKLAQRLAQMESSVAAQRDRDQVFMREVVKGVLLIAGGLAGIGLLALVAIVFLQIRSSKQQALAFANQLQALATHAALPPPAAPVAAIQAVQNQFESTAHRIEQKLSDLEAMAAGLPPSVGTEEPGHPSAGPFSKNQPAPEASIAPAMRRVATAGLSASELLSKAGALLQQQQPEVALAYIDQAIINNPRDAQAYLKRGAALERLNRMNDALSAYDGALEANPSDSVALLAKAGVLNKLQRYGEALKCYEEALARQGSKAEDSPVA